MEVEKTGRTLAVGDVTVRAELPLPPLQAAKVSL